MVVSENRKSLEGVKVFYTRFNKQLPKGLFDYYLKIIPPLLKEKNEKYHFWEDRHRHLFGQLLLLEGLIDYGHKPCSLHNLRYSEYGRPFLENSPDFNISHSGEYVMCALSNSTRVGVDVEKFQEIDLSNFKNVMNDTEWSHIHSSVNPVQKFIEFWTIKESIIKADSRGFGIPILDIDISGNIAEYDNYKWYLKKLDFCNENASSFLATGLEKYSLEVKEVDFLKTNELIKAVLEPA